MEKKFIITAVEEHPGSSAATLVIALVLTLLFGAWLKSNERPQQVEAPTTHFQQSE